MKLDTFTMNIERRYFKNIFEHRRDEVVSAHVFADGSPVTGCELQGMILQLVFVDGTIEEFIMSGVVLDFGEARLIDKAQAFLYSLTLIAGIDHGELRWLISKICFCYDRHGHRDRALRCARFFTCISPTPNGRAARAA